MSVVLYLGDVTPSAYKMDIVPGDSGLDLSTVSACNFKVKKSNGSLLTWAATMTTQTATHIVAEYALGVTSPIDVAGDWHVYALLTVPAGFVRTETDTIVVRDAYDANA